MIFQGLLTVSLLAIVLYSIALRRKIPLLGNVAIGATLAALVLVWRPDLASRLANRLGIGRGADLIFYCWVVISMVMILNLHMKLRLQAESMTDLVRRLAIERPFTEAGKPLNDFLKPSVETPEPEPARAADLPPVQAGDAKGREVARFGEGASR